MIITDIKEWIKVTYITLEEYTKSETCKGNNLAYINLIYSFALNRPKIVCYDNFEMSVQGNDRMASNPRKYTTEYESMEVGFPSEEEPELNSDDVTGYVNIEELQKIIDRHGGIDVIKSGILQLENKYSIIYKRELKLKRILNI